MLGQRERERERERDRETKIMGLKTGRRGWGGGGFLKDKQCSFIYVSCVFRAAIRSAGTGLALEDGGLGVYPRLFVYLYFVVMKGGTREDVPTPRGGLGPPSSRGGSYRDRVVIQLVFDCRKP